MTSHEDVVGNPPYLCITPIMREIRQKCCACRKDPFEPCEYCRAVSSLEKILSQYNKRLDQMRMESKVSEADTTYLSVVQILELNAFFIKLLPVIRLAEQDVKKARHSIDENKIAMM